MPWGILVVSLGKPCEGDCQIQIVHNGVTVGVSKAQKRLYFLNFLQLRPILDDLDFCFVHLQAIGADDEAQEVHGSDAEFTFVDFGIQVVGAKAVEHFLYVSSMIGGVFRVNEYVVQIDYYTYIQ